MKVRSLIYAAGMSFLLCAADPFAEPNASLPDGLPVGPSTPDSDNNDLPSAFSGQEAGYQKAQGTADVQQYGRMQVQPLNVPGQGLTLTCRDTNSNIMAQQKISTKQIDQSWEVYVDPDTNQGGTLINPIRYGMNPPLPKNTNGSTANLPDPNLPSNEVMNGPNGQTYRFAFSLKSMPAVFNNSLGLSGAIWCGPTVDPLDTIQKTIKIELDQTTGNLLNPNMVSLPDGWSIQWSQP